MKAIILAAVMAAAMSIQAVAQPRDEDISETESQKAGNVIERPHAVVQEGAVRFLDAKGQLIKEISLQERREIEERALPGERRKMRYEKTTAVFAALSASREEAAFVETTEEKPLPVKGRPETTDGKTFVSRVSLLDSSGNVLWEKLLPGGRVVTDVSRLKLSDNGEKTVVLTTLGSDDSLPLLLAFDNTGREILKIGMESEEGSFSPGTEIALSPSGKYLAAGIDVLSLDKRTTFFFNLDRKTSWNSREDYLVYEVSDDGFARVEPTGDNDFGATVPLKKFLGM